MQIYLTNLGKYNEGHLMGEWVKLPVSEKEFKEVLERIGIDKEHEEYFISDYEVDEDIAKISEYSSVGYLNEIAELEEILESTTLRALKALVNCGYYDDILEAYEHLHEYIFYDGMNIGDIIDDILAGMKQSRIPVYIKPDRRQAIAFALKKAGNGDTILIAGKGHEEYQIIGSEKLPFDEREIIKECLL